MKTITITNFIIAKWIIYIIVFSLYFYLYWPVLNGSETFFGWKSHISVVDDSVLYYSMSGSGMARVVFTIAGILVIIFLLAIGEIRFKWTFNNPFYKEERKISEKELLYKLGTLDPKSREFDRIYEMLDNKKRFG